MMRRITLVLLLMGSITMASTPPTPDSLWKRVAKFLGLTAAPNPKGDDDQVIEGNIHLYNVETRQISPLKQGTFRSPIFLPADRTILALNGEKVVKFDFALKENELTIGEVTDVRAVPGIKKLIGVEKDAPDQVLVITDLDNDNCPNVGVLSLADGSVVPVPYADNAEDRDIVTYLRGWEREYDDGTKLLVKLETKKRNGADVAATNAFLKLRDKGLLNVSNCAPGVNCGQPAISSDRKFLLFVRKI